MPLHMIILENYYIHFRSIQVCIFRLPPLHRLRVDVCNVELLEKSLRKRFAVSLGEVEILPSETNREGKEGWQKLQKTFFARDQR